MASMERTHSDETASSNDQGNALDAAMVFSAPLVRKLEDDRLPPNYVGVRRVRASSRAVFDAFRSGKDETTQTETVAPVVYKLTDKNGVERRMTNQEKKELKFRLRKERNEARKKQKQESLCNSERQYEEIKEKTKEDSTNVETDVTNVEMDTITCNAQKRNYHVLQVNQTSLEEELAELRGDRNGVPPALLSPCMISSAVQSLGQTRDPPENINKVILDDELARIWAVKLKKSMEAAEEVRSREDMRPMAYQLVPEVWARLRPSFSSDTKSSVVPCTVEKGNAIASCTSSRPWSFITIRPRLDPFDTDGSVVYNFLQNRSNLHVACGSKFGSDFLLYDGRREERHAFAGLRIVSHDKLPTAYDMAGFVRCLNTAGKLALLAFVQYEETTCIARIAFVDIALEKILSAPTHQKKRSLSSSRRRDMGKNLSKVQKL